MTRIALIATLTLAGVLGLSILTTALVRTVVRHDSFDYHGSVGLTLVGLLVAYALGTIAQTGRR